MQDFWTRRRGFVSQFVFLRMSACALFLLSSASGLAQTSEALPRPKDDSSAETSGHIAQEVDESALTVEAETEPQVMAISPQIRRDKEPTMRGPFRKKKIRLGGHFGATASETERWFVVGPSVGYFIVDGLEVHADAAFWLVGEPFVFAPSPAIRYVFRMVPQVKPYVGVFYRRYFVASGERSDVDALGARAGGYFMTGKNSYFGAGVVYEHHLQDHFFKGRNQFFPEISFSLSIH